MENEMFFAIEVFEGPFEGTGEVAEDVVTEYLPLQKRGRGRGAGRFLWL